MSTDFITYAQNAEDVMLWRALQHVERGFYIDVGAQDPVVDSVTKAFYERGWHGVNIEPVERWYHRLTEDRPHDINLPVATSDHVGELVLFNVEDTGLSTSDPGLAKRYVADGRSVREVTVGCRTLDDICSDHGISTVHFLKIDCEGAEKQTLQGFSLEAVRPWIILVESTEPNSTKSTHRQWEHLLVERGYRFVYFDGLNRFYLANEHAEIRQAFGAPPTPAEWKERGPMVSAHRKIHQLTHEIARHEHALSELRKLVDALREESLGLSGEIGRLQREIAATSNELVLTERAREEAQFKLSQQDVRVHGLEDEITRLQREVAATSNELVLTERAREEARFKLLQQDVRVHGLEDEITRLQREVAEFMQRQDEDGRAKQDLQSQLMRAIDRTNGLEGEVAQMRASHSWVMTAPLRKARRVISRGMRYVAKVTLRPPARALRPWLRTLSRRDVLRKPVVGALGHDSTLVRHARLFLFGPPVQADPQTAESRAEATCDEVPGNGPFVASHRERVVMEALRGARNRASGRGHAPCE